MKPILGKRQAHKFSPEAFLEACGVSGSLGLLVQQADSAGSAPCFFRQPFALVGRNNQNDVIVKDKRTSRRHAYIQVLNGAYFCVDLNSRTGCRWEDGARCADWLRPGQSLGLGAAKVCLPHDLETHAPTDYDPMAAGCLEEPLVSVEFLNARTTQTHWPMNRVLALIGTATQCKLRLHHSQVAPIHASLISTPSGAWVVDLLAPSGTYVNGQRVRMAKLDNGDELRIGSFSLRVLTHGSHSSIRRVRAPASAELAPLHSTATMDLAVAPNDLAALGGGAQFVRGPDGNARRMLESVFYPMVEQFNSMQSQMFDQFQQAMITMFQMFGNLQKEQMERVYGELNKVQELTREIQTLKAQLTTSPGPPPAVLNRPAEVNVCSETAADHAVMPRTLADEAKLPGPGLAATGKSTSNPDLRPSNGESKTAAEVHSWLCQRMTELQEDRRTRMQRIISFISGT